MTSGKLMLYTKYMLSEVLASWIPLLVIFCVAFGLALNLLAPQSPNSNDSSMVSFWSGNSGSSPGTINMAVDGPLFAPWWGVIDMFYTPESLADLWQHKDTNILTPLFVWSYLILAVILFVSTCFALMCAFDAWSCFRPLTLCSLSSIVFSANARVIF